MDSEHILHIERPHPKLFTYYLILGFILPPFSLLLLPVLYFRYHTMRYRFDAEGVSMSWGILFRRQVNLTYARIQDIHLTSGIIQRWLGLADIHIQTASGSSSAEMKIEGLLEYEQVRDFLYTKMRGYKDRMAGVPAHPTDFEAGVAAAAADHAHSGGDAELAMVLREIQTEMRQIREAIESKAPNAGSQTHD